MVVVKFWILLAVTVFVATIITARNVPAVETATEWPSLIKREALAVSSNRTELQKKWKDPLQEGKWHFKTPNRVLSHNKFQDVGEKTLEKSLILYTPFSKKLFMNPTSQKIIKEALSTTFIKGMAQGKFPLSNYRNFLEQDAAYFYHVADVYRLAAVKMDIQNNKEYANFYWRQSTKFYHLHENFIREKALSGEGQEGRALQAYKEFLSNVGPEHLALAMLPCSMLYPELARVEVQNPAGNVYEEDFFKENRRDDESSTEKFVNEIKDITEQRALLIFWRGLKHELNLLREVGDQPALPIQQL